MWDTAGQERFAPMTKKYFEGAAVVIYVQDASLIGQDEDAQPLDDAAEQVPKGCHLVSVFMKSDLLDDSIDSTQVKKSPNVFSKNDPKKIQNFVLKLADTLWFDGPHPPWRVSELGVQNVQIPRK